jgi:hypothetical protein
MAWVCAMLAATLVLASPSSEEFERGKTAFGRAEYLRAIDILRPLLYPDIRLDSESDVVQAHRILGVAHLFENQPDEARREFRKLLELRPDYRFDPLLDPSRVVEFFNGVLKEEEIEIASLEAARKKRDADLARRQQREADARCAAQSQVFTYQKHSYAINFIPFGAGQFQNGQPRKGWAFLGVEAAFSAISLGALATNFSLFGVSHQRRCLDPPTSGMTSVTCRNVDHSEESLSHDLVRVQVVSGGLFLAAAAWGIIDAIRNFRPSVLNDTEPSRAGAGTSPKTGARLRLESLPMARASSLGVEWSF